MVGTVAVSPELVARLSAWLDDIGIEGGVLADLEPLSGGTQNTMLRFTRGGRGLVLRMPPKARASENQRGQSRTRD